MLLLSPLYNSAFARLFMTNAAANARIEPNRILEKQRAIQNDPRKIMYRLPRSGLYLGTFGALFVASSLGTVFGVYSLIRGKSD
ncbi:hypothetical protein C0995_016330 [Termitomyces sp. Mi166|nr:hypothetical protein C0995_016330 [Termitomyces sp. Mi166\